jgi:multicomponent Na+:H+ antiporter subunit C
MILINYAPYITFAAIFSIGLYGIMANHNLIKKILALSILQSSIIILFISLGKVTNGQPPILINPAQSNILYSNPLPHVLMLTAIVVGLATLAVGLALVIRIKESYGTLDDNEISIINLKKDD